MATRSDGNARNRETSAVDPSDRPQVLEVCGLEGVVASDGATVRLPAALVPVVELAAATRTSFDRFFVDEYPAVVRLVLPLTRSRPVAEDVAQEAFASAMTRWARISGFDRPDLWVRRVALNRAIGVARRRGSEEKALARLRTYGAALPAPADDHRTPPDEALWAAVRALPRRQSQLVVLVYVDDRSIDDAAHALGMQPSTARTHLQRARATLAAALSSEQSGDLDG